MDSKTVAKTLYKALLGGAIVVMASGALFAGETLTLSSGASNLAGTAAMCGTPTAGLICFSGTVGDWNVMQTIGTGMPDGSSAINPDQDLSIVATTLGGAPPVPSLTITFTETGFGPASAGSLSYLESGILTKPGMTDTFSYQLDSTTYGTNMITTPGGTAFGTPTISPFPVGQYTITLTEVITAAGAGAKVSSDFDVNGVTTPEPGLYAMTGIGLLGLMALAIRRKNKQVSEL